jgi:YidC/Oxa1 family membrane protein insertase
LSTLQQIWLQKLGGAKNPLRQVLDDDVKNVDLMHVQKSVSNLNFTKIEEARKDSKLTSEGPRLGDKYVDQMQVQKSVSNLNFTKIEEARKDSKLTSEWPRLGDRLVIIIITSHTYITMLLIDFNLL